MDDNLLVKRIKEGDKEAFYEVYKSNKDTFLRFCLKYYSLSYEQIEDIYHDLILLFRDNCMNGTLNELEKASLKTYLFGIGKNLISDDFRKNKKKNVSIDPIINAFPDTLHSEGPDDEALQVKYILRSGRLGERCTEILIYFFHLKFSLSEIQKLLNIRKANTLSQRKKRCLAKLKEMIHIK